MFKKLIMLVFCTTFLSACGAGKDKTNVELIQDMMNQISNKAQGYDSFRKQGSNRVPPKGTKPIGFNKYKYPGQGKIEEASRNLVNPLKHQFGPEVLETGKKNFNIYCAVCHSMDGSGAAKTLVGQKMLIKPPTLLSTKVKGYTDGRLFHVLSEGYGVMGSYSRQIIKQEDRWKVVNYIRTLQKQAK